MARGHVTNAPATIIYSSIFSREILCIALMKAVLNDLELKLSDISNAYVQVPITEKVWTMLDPAFGNNADGADVIVRALNRFKSWPVLLNPWGVYFVGLA